MSPDIRWVQRFHNYKHALTQLESAVLLSRQRELSPLEKQGLIQAFEFTHELAWNVMKDYFSYQGNPNITGSRDAVRESFAKGLITEGEGWMEMIKSRNQTSHTHNQTIADEIVEKVIHLYFPLFTRFNINMQAQTIRFEKVEIRHLETIFSWLAEPHMQEFWDNSPEHKEDIIHFVNGRKTPSQYFNGIFTYWVGLYLDEPYCFILTARVDPESQAPDVWTQNISTTGVTYSLDFGIGNRSFLGKKLAAETLDCFTRFFQENVDREADTFFIDPAADNGRAVHVYEKAGFQPVGDFVMDRGVFSGEDACLMVKKLRM